LADGAIKITLDVLTGDAKGKVNEFVGATDEALGSVGDKSSSTFDALKIAGIAAFTAVAAAVVGFAKQAFEAYAQYEQLAGGVSKLYGTAGKSIEEYASSVGKSVSEVEGEYNRLQAAQDLVFKNANDAWKTAGMDANQYMEVATSFSASLINSLGGDTVAAAQQTDVAMRAISDNVNTFGTNADSVTQAFQGFARQNFMMLDNLKLGYSGSKEGMQQLIADANAYAAANGQAANLSIDSFSDIVTAIELVQEKQGIAGTTAREAATTIEGSITSLGAAWNNFVAGIGKDGVDLEPLVQNVVEALGNVVHNVVPVAGRIMAGLGSALINAVPQMVQGLGSAITDALAGVGITLPSLNIDGQMFDNLNGALDPVIEHMQNVSDMLVRVFNNPTVQAGITSIVGSLNDIGNVLTATFANAIQAIVDILEPFIPVVENLAVAIMPALRGEFEFIAGVFAGLAPVFSIVFDILSGLANVIASVLLVAVAAMTPYFEAVGAIFSFVGEYAQALGMALMDVYNVIVGSVQEALTNISNWINNDVIPAVTAFSAGVSALSSLVGDAFNSMVSAVSRFASDFANGAKRAADDFGSNLRSGLDTVVNGIGSVGRNIVDGIVGGIRGAIGNVTSALRGGIESAINNVKGFLGIHSPSRLMRDLIGINMAKGVAVGIDVGWKKSDPFSGMRQDINDNINGVQLDISRNGSMLSSWSNGSSTSTKINQTFNTNVVRADDDLYTAATIIHRNALYEAQGV
jgi:phage-related protein